MLPSWMSWPVAGDRLLPPCVCLLRALARWPPPCPPLALQEKGYEMRPGDKAVETKKNWPFF